MSGVGDWFRDFWRQPVAARTIVIVLFLGITSLYCFGFASLVAGSRLRPKVALSLATLTPDAPPVSTPRSVPSPTVTVAVQSVTPTQSATTLAEVVREPSSTMTPIIELVVVREATSTSEATGTPTAEAASPTRVAAETKTPVRRPAPSALARRTPVRKRSPIALSARTPTQVPTPS